MRIGSVVGVTILACSVSLFAGQGQTDLSKLTRLNPQPVSLKFQDAEFTDILQFLGRAFGVEIRLAPDAIAKRPPMSVAFTNAKFEDVFGFLMTATKLNYTVIDEKTVFVSQKAP